MTDAIGHAVYKAIQDTISKSNNYDRLIAALKREAQKRDLIFAIAQQDNRVYFKNAITHEMLTSFATLEEAVEYIFNQTEHYAVQVYEENRITAR